MSSRVESRPRIERVDAGSMGLLDHVADDVFDHPIDVERLRAFVAQPCHALFVAVDGGRVIGQARGMIHLQPDKAPDLYVDNLGVAPTHRRGGIAAALIAALRAWGEGEGCEVIWVCTETDNDAAKAFYDAQDFTGETIAYFSNPLR